MERVRVFLISGHMSVIDQPKIELNDSTNLITYGKVGESNLNSDFVNVENMFFMNSLPTNVSRFKFILPTLPPETSHKKFKLQSDTYHDVSITLCSYVYVNEQNEPCNTEQEAVRVELFLSGIYEMIDKNINTADQARDYISSKHVTINQEYSVSGNKQFFVRKRNVISLYRGALVKADLLNILFGKKEKITLQKFIEGSKDNLSNIIAGLPDGNKICILDGCRDYYGNSYEDRAHSSASDNSGSSIESEDMNMLESSASSESASSEQDVVPPQVASQVVPSTTKIAFKSHQVKSKSRIIGKIDSLHQVKTKGRAKGKSSFLVSMPSNRNAGKKTRKKKRKNKRK